MHRLALRFNSVFSKALDTVGLSASRTFDDTREQVEKSAPARGGDSGENTSGSGVNRSPVYQFANLRGSARLFFISYLLSRTRLAPLVVVCENARAAERAKQHAITAYRILTEKFERELDFLVFPDSEPVNLFDYTQPDVETVAMRGIVLESLIERRPCVVFVTPQSLFSRLPVPETMRDTRLRITSPAAAETGGTSKSGQKKVTRSELAGKLEDFGYERANLVFEPGQYSIRGGIIDVFPAGDEHPVRVDFFGDDVEEMSRFNPETQRSFEKIGEFTLLPVASSAGSTKSGGEIVSLVRAKLEAYTAEHGARLPGSVKKLSELIEEDLFRIANGIKLSREGFYRDFVDSGATFFDYLRDGATFLVHDEALVEGELRTFERFWRERFLEWRRNALTIADFGDYYSITDEKLFTYIKRYRESAGGKANAIFTYTFEAPHALETMYDFDFGTPGGSKYRLGYLNNTLVDMGAKASEVWIASQFAERLREQLTEEGAQVGAVEKYILPGGFEFPDAGMLLTDAEIFGEIEEAVVRKQRRYEKAGLKAVDEISIGDYVVHIDYGIGRFVALSDQEVAGVTRSYVEIEYEGKDKLYVPVEQLDRLRKYRWDGNAPKLNSLGRATWKKIKRKIRLESLKMAMKLYKLYRKRSTIVGESFTDKEGWLNEFGAAFPYELTPDQTETWELVCNDMLAPRPMERLICGDVGFGKTEIALRAAFLACTNDKQVLVLCPTTILADQHHHTFRRRFAPFPFRVEMLSRFLGKKEQDKIIVDFNAGKVDVLIGTHRVLSKDVKPKTMGLLVIDEEQRFGVKQKEQLKLRFPNVDSLMLTATPIPRTLHMALVGMRDVSLIETPPVDRKPVRTLVGEFDKQIVRDAILKEIGRAGQVYYLHNRVLDIDVAKSDLEELVPEAKIITAHGQMKEDRLEEIMNAFALGAFNVLIATTIIENGLDIPNVNTLIVENAENLGLAQMHQLRGRVGRSHVQAFAYFFHEPERGLTPDAQGRLHAIYNFAYLGAGYEIAQSDLRLRGAGNIFGEEQSGLAQQVGYDYYFELLEGSFEAVRNALDDIDEDNLADENELLEKFEEEDAGCFVDVPIPAYIPPDYIDDSVLRLDLLRRIARLDSSQTADYRLELKDRFGEPPIEVDNLLDVIGLRTKARDAGIVAIEYMRTRQAFRMRFREGRPVWAGRITLLDSKAELSPEGFIDYKIPLEDATTKKLLNFLERLLRLKQG